MEILLKERGRQEREREREKTRKERGQKYNGGRRTNHVGSKVKVSS